LQALRMRKLGSGLGAIALIAGFAGSAIGLVTATAASAAPPTGTYSCTITDTANGNHVVATGLTYPASVPSGTLTGVTPGDPINFTCSNIGASESVAIVQAQGLAALDNPNSEQSYADIGHGNLGATATPGGGLNSTSATLSTYVNSSDAAVTCPTNSTAANLGVFGCLMTVADIGTETPLVLFNVAYGSDAAATDPTLTPATSTLNANTSTTPLAVSTTAGFWWGASEFGTGGASPIPNPTVLVDGTHPIQTAGAGDGSSTLTVSPAAYCIAGSSPNNPADLGPQPATGPGSPGPIGYPPGECLPNASPGVPTHPQMTGSLVVPSGLTKGLHTITVVEGTLEAGSISSSFSVFVPGATAGGATLPSGNIGPNTSATISGSTGWDPNSSSVFTGTWEAPVGCSVTSEPATSLAATPAHPTDPAGTESFTVNSSDIPTAVFSNPSCVPGIWTLNVVQTVGATTVASAAFTPINLVDLTATCSIAATGTCLVQQGLSEVVHGTNLTVTEYAATEGIGAPGQNPSAILVNLSPVTLGPGVFQAGQGELNTVEVNDSRGTLSGWTVTGILEGDFVGPNVGNDNTIPADYLTWNPSVSLTFPGNLNAGVAPFGTVSPPVYGPDACAAGSQATDPTVGTNTNIPCPTVNDNAGANNPSGNATTGQIGGSTAPSNHAGEPNWPAANAEGPSGLLSEAEAGPIANLGTANTGNPDFGTQGAQVLCEAPTGGGGGAFNCDASLSLAVPPYVAAGTYTATMDLLTTAT
jgi:hypothetical protein